jgi:DNA-binding CsgD family transcriptional regulator
MKKAEIRSQEVSGQPAENHYPSINFVALRLSETAYAATENTSLWQLFYRDLYTMLGGRAAAVVIRGFGPTSYVNMADPDPGLAEFGPPPAFLSKSLSRSNFGIAYLSASRDARSGQIVYDRREFAFMLRELESNEAANPVAIELGLSSPEAGLGPRDTALLMSLFPHWHRALAIGHRLSHVEEYRSNLDDALDALRIGVMVLGPRGQLKAANHHARQYLKGNTTLYLEKGELALSEPQETEALIRKIKSAAFGADPNPTPTVVEIENAEPALLWLQSFRPGLALGIVTDGAGRRPIAPEVLQEAFALTRTEAAVASLFSGGAPPLKIAENLHVSLQTVKQKLAKIRDRTQMGSGVELMRFLMASVPATVATEEGVAAF